MRNKGVFFIYVLLAIFISPSSAAVKTQVSTGDSHTVGLKSDGNVVAVGYNGSGQCNVSSWSGISQLSAGFYHTVAVKTDGTVVAVGENGNGECNVSGWSGITQVSAGLYHTVGLKSDGTVIAVGRNDDGQCNVSSWSSIALVSAGRYHTVGLKSDGTVVAVGYNGSGQCNVSSWNGITQVSAGGWHTVGLKSDGTVVAVGNNSNWQCDVSSWSEVIQISAGDEYTIGLKSDSTVVAVGYNGSGQCNVSSWSEITQVSAGRYHTLGLKSDGTVAAVGYNGHGQCSMVRFYLHDFSAPQVVGGGWHTVGLKSDGTAIAVGQNDSGQCNVSGWSGITQVSAGLYHTVGLKSDGTVVAVGRNGDGQCNVSSWTGITQVSAGFIHTLGLKSDGTVVAVGYNGSGRCDVSGWSGITQVSAGGLHTVGLKTDGMVVAVGYNDYGQCNVSGWSGITQVSAGTYHSAGLKSNGTVVAGGYNSYSECDVSGWSGITQVSAGHYHTVGSKTDGTVVAIGLNNDGQCDVSGWSNITQVSVGYSHTVGLKSDGLTVAVGDNYYGQCDMFFGWNLIRRIFSGRVTLDGVGLKDVAISGLTANSLTNDSGYYVDYADSGWSGTATPTRSGYTFTPTSIYYFMETTHQFDQDYSATIIPVISVTSPNGGEPLYIGTNHNITWTTDGIVGDVRIEYSTNNGDSYQYVTSSTINDGSYSWLVPNTPSAECLVKISEAADGDPSDVSDSVFTIQQAIVQYTLTIETSTGGTTDPAPGDHDYGYDTPVEVDALPDSGYLFSYWSGDVPGGHETDNPVTITMDGDKNITAHFAQIGWKSTKRLTWNPSDSNNPAVAVDSQRYVHMVWEDDNPGNYEIYYRKSTDGGVTWTSTKRLTWNSGDSRNPVIAIASNDNIHVVWDDDSLGTQEIFYRKSMDGGAGWTAVKRLTQLNGDSKVPSIAVDSYTDIHIVWFDMTPGNNEIYYSKSTNQGVSWSNPKRMTWNASSSTYPSIAAGSGNDIHILWQDDGPGNEEIYYKRSTNGGTSWPLTKRMTWNSGDSTYPCITSDSGNNIHVVWIDLSPGNNEVFYKKSTNGGTNWPLTKRLTWNSGASGAPSVATDAGDNIYVVWNDDTPGNYEIYYKRSTNGGGAWSTKRLTWNSGDSVVPDLATYSTGEIHIVWADDSPGNQEIYYRKGIQ